MLSCAMSVTISDKMCKYLWFLLPLVIAIIANKALGYAFKPRSVLFIYCIILLLSLNSILLKVVLIPWSCLVALYLPVGIIYGNPSIGILASAAETNLMESIEFIKSIPIQLFFISILFVLIIYLHYRLNRRFCYIKKSNKQIYAVVAILPLTFIGHNWDANAYEIDFGGLSPLAFYQSAYSSYVDYSNEIESLKISLQKRPSWQVISKKFKYQTYIVIIGESMRRDYMSAYGYPLDTTPFLRTTPGTLIDGYISAAPNTFTSLSRSLGLTENGQLNPADTFITLAEAAGIKTFWLSNQGYLGPLDSPISHIAVRSDSIYFTKHEYNSANVDDFILLDQLKQILAAKTDHPRLIVMHIMGSHPNFCERLAGEKPSFNLINENISCYLSSLKRTDRFIKETHDIVKSTQSPFSIVYFSDHGLRHYGNKSELDLRHGENYQSDYDVPLVKISSDDTEHKIIKTQKSAFHFMNMFAQWTGIHVKQIQNDYDFFSATNDKNIKVFNTVTEVPYASLAADPAVTPSAQ